MSSQSVVEGDREPVQSRGRAPKNSDGLLVTEQGSADHLAQSDTSRPQKSRGESRVQQTRGSPGGSALRNVSQPTLREILRDTLKDDEMTSRARSLMVTGSVCLAIVLVPIAAVVCIVMVRSPVDVKFILGGGTPVFVALASWLVGRHKSAKKSGRLVVAGCPEEPA